MYPSRSELIRVAVRDFLIREIEASKSFLHYHRQQKAMKDVNTDLLVQVPMDTTVEGVTEFKTYKIIKRKGRA